MRQAQRVEIAMAITSEHLRPGRKILDRKNGGVKFNRDIVITGEATNTDQILNKVRRNKNIVQVEGFGGSGNECVCLVRDRQPSTIAHCNGGGRWVNGGRVKVTRRGGHVRRRAGVEVLVGGAGRLLWSAGRLEGSVKATRVERVAG